MIRPEADDDISATSRRSATLSSKLDKRMLAYMAAASAAGIGMAGLAPAAEAKVVYTPANEAIGATTYLDLNHDGVADFKFITTHTSHCVGYPCTSTGRHVQHGTAFNSQNGKLAIYGSGRNQIWGSGKYASALNPKIGIGPWGKFPKSGDNLMVIAHNDNSSFTSPGYGPWNPQIQNRYLGLRFLINGQIHYGWARLNVTVHRDTSITAVLTGYAYETVPNRPIITGETHGPLQASNRVTTPPPVQPASEERSLGASEERSLGMLALGSVWLERRQNNPAS